MSFDNVCKYLAEQYPETFVKWLLGNQEEKIKVLKTELNLEPIRADSVLFLRVGKSILHLEFQTSTKSQPPLSFRMLDYYVRLKRKYNCPIIQIIIFLKKSNSPIVFQEKYEDEKIVHKYKVIRLWEEDTNYFLSQPNLYPFAVLTNNEYPQETLEKVAQKINEIELKELQADLIACTSILAGLTLEAKVIKSLLKEETMKSSVIYQEIKKAGKIEGKIEEALNLTLKIINQNLGKIDSNLLDKIKNLSLENLENLTLSSFNFKSLGDLELWLEDKI